MNNLIKIYIALHFFNVFFEEIQNRINQSINQSINVFQGKIQTVQFTNIYKHILFLHDIHMILVIMKTN